MQEFTFDTPDAVAIEPEPPAAAPIEPVMAPPEAAEISLEPIEIEAAPASPAQEIDISNEWEDMIEVEPAESAAAELQVQSYQEVAEEITQRGDVEPGPAATAKAPEADLSSQVEDKIQEIRFYVTQEMWEPAKAAILDLTTRGVVQTAVEHSSD